MTRAVAAALLAALAVMAGCAPQAEAPAAPAPALSAPGLPLPIPYSGEQARTLVEQVAARCWLDHVVRGGSMVVDRATGKVIITSDTADLLTGEIVPTAEGSIVRLTGPAPSDPATALRLSETLEAAVQTGRTDCAPAA